MLDFSILIDYFDMYWDGFKVTVIASLIALIASFILGAIIAVMRITPIAPLVDWNCVCRVFPKYSTRSDCLFLLLSEHRSYRN